MRSVSLFLKKVGKYFLISMLIWYLGLKVACGLTWYGAWEHGLLFSPPFLLIPVCINVVIAIIAAACDTNLESLEVELEKILETPRTEEE